MRLWFKSLVLPLALVLMMLAANVALAHPWGPAPYGYHWNRYGASVTIGTYNTSAAGRYYNLSDAARAEWDSKTILALPRNTAHTDISIFSANSGATGWAGLASIESWQNSSLNHIGHAHAQVNTYYTNGYSDNDVRGVYCQEIGHTFGLDHSNTGDCMGAGYYNSAYTLSSHNVNDISSVYRNTHH